MPVQYDGLHVGRKERLQLCEAKVSMVDFADDIVHENTEKEVRVMTEILAEKVGKLSPVTS